MNHFVCNFKGIGVADSNKDYESLCNFSDCPLFNGYLCRIYSLDNKLNGLLSHSPVYLISHLYQSSSGKKISFSI